VKVRTEARRAAYVEVAAQVFLEKGFEGTSMSEIAQRMGGSRATLYGYFPTKEDIFIAVTMAEGEKHMVPAMAEMTTHTPGELQEALVRFAATLLRFLASDTTCAVNRMVLGEAGRSDIGQLFYEAGPRKGITGISDVLQSAMDRGELRSADAWVAALHFAGLINAEIEYRRFYRDNPPVTAAKARQMAERAVEVFMRGYAP
jgi:AcrR family transcriptional regulator